MNTVTNYFRQAMIVVGAFALTASLLVGSFSADPAVASVAEMVA